MKPWIGCEIRLVRSQIGWSRTQLAKYLGCSPLKVVKMENDDLIPLKEEKAKLEALSYEVCEHLERHALRQQADSLMDELGVDQLHIDDVEANFRIQKMGVDN